MLTKKNLSLILILGVFSCFSSSMAFAAPILKSDPAHPSPTSLGVSLMEAPVLAFELDTVSTPYSGVLNRLEFAVLNASANILPGYSLFNLSTSSNIVASANIIAGNVVFQGLSIGLSGGSNILLQLKVNTPATFSAGNIQFEMQPSGIALNDNAVVGGSLVSSGMIGLGTPPVGPNLKSQVGFSSPTTLNTNVVDVPVLGLELDTVGPAYSGVLNKIEFTSVGANLMSDFTGFNLFNVSTSSNVSGNASLIAGNVVFQNLSLGLSGGSNTILQLKVNTANTFNSANVQFGIQPLALTFANNALAGGSPINVGPITLGGNNTPPVGPNLMPDLGYTKPANFATSQANTALFSFELDTTHTAYNGTLDHIELELIGANTSNFLNYHLFNIVSSTDVSSTPTVVGANVGFNLAFALNSSGNAKLQVRADTAVAFSSANVEFKIQPIGLHVSDNANFGGSPVVSGNIALGTPVVVGPNLMPDLGYTKPANFVTSQANIALFSFELDTTHTSYNGTLDHIELELIGANTSNFLNYHLFNIVSSTDVSSTPTVVGANVGFNLAFALNSSANTKLQVRADTAVAFSSANVEFKIQPIGLHVSDNANFGGSPVVSGNIALGTPVVVGPNLMPDLGYTKPANFATSQANIALFSFELDTTHTAYNGTLDHIELELIGANTSNFLNYHLFNIVNSTDVSSTPTAMGSNVGFNLAFALNSSGNAKLQVRADTAVAFSSANVEFKIQPIGLHVSDNANFGGSPIVSGVIDLGSSANVVDPFQKLRIAAGQRTAFAIGNNHYMYSAGLNDVNQIGRMGNPAFAASVATPSTVVAVSAGVSHGLALTTDGHVLSWGWNQFGQSNPSSNVVVDNGVANIVQIEAGAFASFAISANNELWVKGRNHKGQLGLGNFNDSPNWTLVTGLPAGNIQDVSSGVEHTLILISGNIYGCGSNGYAQLGNANLTLTNANFGLISGNGTWKMVKAGGFHSLAIDVNANAWAWGKNDMGQLGLGNTNLIFNPSQLTSISLVRGLAAGYDHSLFIVEQGVNKICYGAGSNRQGQLAKMGKEYITPVMVNTYTDVNDIEAGPYSSMLIRAGQYVKAWGQMPDGRDISVFEMFFDFGPM